MSLLPIRHERIADLAFLSSGCLPAVVPKAESSVCFHSLSDLHLPETIFGMTPFEAARVGDLPVVAAYVYGGIQLSTQCCSDHKAGTMLHYAAEEGHVDVVRYLLHAGTPVDAVSGCAQNSDETAGQTALFWALRAGREEIFEILIKQGADIMHKDCRGRGLLFYSLWDPLVLHGLRKRVFPSCNLQDAGFTSDGSGSSLLHAAAAYDFHRTVLYLLEELGMDVNVRDLQGNTPLHICARSDHLITFRCLISKQADLNIRNTSGDTPLDLCGKVCLGAYHRYQNCMTIVDKERALQTHTSRMEHIQQHPHLWFGGLITFLAPNLALWVSAHIHVLAVIITFLALIGSITVISRVQLRQHGSLFLPGWVTGAMICSLVSFNTDVIPYLSTCGRPILGFFPLLANICGIMMLWSFIRAVFTDPGIVQSTPEIRSELYASANTTSVVAEVNRREFCTSCLMRRPQRSKHCGNTAGCIYRFDHYCIWTGSAIGGGNHRPFYAFLVFQCIAQSIVIYSTTQMCRGCYTLREILGGQAPHALVAVALLLMYGIMTFTIMGSILVTQTRLIGRNLTCNELWFPNRYRWLFLLGDRVYSFYDEGFWANWRSFLWQGDLCRACFQRPPQSEYLRAVTRKYFDAEKSSSTQSFKGLAVAEAPVVECDHGMDFESREMGCVNEGGMGRTTGSDDENSPHCENQALVYKNEKDGAFGTGPAISDESAQNSMVVAQNDFLNVDPKQQREMRILQNILEQINQIPQANDTDDLEGIVLPGEILPHERTYYEEQVRTMRERNRAMRKLFESINLQA